VALGSTQPVTEMSIRNFPGVKGGRRVRLTTLSPSVSLWAFTACYRDSFTPFFLPIFREKHVFVYNCYACAISVKLLSAWAGGSSVL
jgi:hypothetical protein